MTRIVVDACCLINLAAADALANWLADLGHDWILPEMVAREVLTLRGRGPDGEPTTEPVLLQDYIESGLLSLIGIDDEQELSAFITYAQSLDDGEAMALAIAKGRRYILATDDRKAQKIARTNGIEVLSTAAIIREWVDLAVINDHILAETLDKIRRRGRFIPGAGDPLRDWWLSHLPE